WARERRSFFFQAEDGIRGFHVTGVQTCALPISTQVSCLVWGVMQRCGNAWRRILPPPAADVQPACPQRPLRTAAELAHQLPSDEIGRASCRESVQKTAVGVARDDESWVAGQRER